LPHRAGVRRRPPPADPGRIESWFGCFISEPRRAVRETAGPLDADGLRRALGSGSRLRCAAPLICGVGRLDRDTLGGNAGLWKLLETLVADGALELV